MKRCKQCSTLISDTRTYCSNTCKFADTEYNASRTNKLKKVIVKKYKCDDCGWQTDDVDNKAGSLMKHFKSTHGFTEEMFYTKFPNIQPSARYILKKNSQSSNIQCEICGIKVHKITNTHLKLHNITLEEYKTRYGYNVISSQTRAKQIGANISDQINKIFDGTRVPDTLMPLFAPDEYYGVDRKFQYKFRCTICGMEFKDHFDDGNIPTCMQCNPPKDFSPSGRAQTELYEYICSIYSGNILKNCRTAIAPKELDIYLPDINIAIEYHGMYWHSDKFLDKNYHLEKLNMCTAKGIRLIQIFEDEWLSKKEIVKSRISHLLGITKNKIYARSTSIRQISTKEIGTFLSDNHIQGNDVHSSAYGLFYEDRLVMVATFCYPRIALGGKKIPDKMELSRLCSKLNYLVVGGAQKLIKYFIKHNPNVKLYSYADLRYTDPNNNVYLTCGFSKVSQSRPGYWYFKIGNGGKKYHRFMFTKQKLINEYNLPDTMTEFEMASSVGFGRIWDCGHLKYELNII